MGKKKGNKKKGLGAKKTAMKTDKKQIAKQKKLLEKIGEVDINQVIAKLEAEEAILSAVTETVCTPPTPRSSFTIVAHPEKEELILFGGEFFNGSKICIYNDLYFYNIAKNEWKIVKSPGGPTPRSGHQMVATAIEGGQLWLFGGEHASPSQLQFYHYKDLWVLRLNTKKWEKINAPNGPTARSGHRMITSKKKLIVFGGFHDNNQTYEYFNDVHIFSLESYTWLKIEITGSIQPSPRSGCCLASCPDGKILIWGGYSKSRIKKDTDRGITHTDMFSLVQDKTNPNKFKWTSVKPNGYKPLPRNSVGYSIAANNKAYCFGGAMDVEEDEEMLQGQFGDELLSLDLSTITWRSLVIKNCKAKPKTGVSSIDEPPVSTETTTVTTNGIFTVTLGGSRSQSNKTDLFSIKPKSGPTGRMNPGVVVCKGILYIFGGLFEDDNKQFTYNDFYSIDLHKLDDWKTIIPNNLNAHDWIDSDSDSMSEESSSDSDSESSEDDTSTTDSSFSDLRMDTN